MIKKRKKEDKKLKAKSFLERYYGISNDDIAQMTHQTLSEFFPQLKRTSFEHIQKNPELVNSGQIILVEDAKKYLVPYLAPNLSTNDLDWGCNQSELMVQRVINIVLAAMENHTKILFIIEGKQNLDKYLFMPQAIDRDLLSCDEIPEMTTAITNGTGLIIKNDYSLVGYQVLNHGDNCYHTVILPALQRQAVGISRKTDASAILYENERLYLIVNGISEYISDAYQLRKFLMQMFPPEFSGPTDPVKTDSVVEQGDYTFSEMTTYELEKLMEVYRASNQRGYYHVVRRELIKRTKDSKEFRKKKERQKEKEFKRGRLL